jgi:SHS2 domain-containing protein
MTIQPLDHTADVGVEISAESLEELYAEAAVAFCQTITVPSTVRPRERRRVVKRAPDRVELMVEWLEELLYLFDAHELLFAAAEVTLDEPPGVGFELRGEIAGERFDPDRHPVKVAIKGITYHGLEVRERDGGWWARVIFDI